MKKLTLILCLLSFTAMAKNSETAQSKNQPWGGYWWSMLNAELALGWESDSGRTTWYPDQVELFDSCLTTKSAYCENLIKTYAEDSARELSPLMKFDLFMKKYVEKTYGKNAPLIYYSHAAKRELEIHYIGNNRDHPHYESRGFAGKCIGWALSTFDYKEPVKTKKIMGISFEPADIKGILAGIYNGAQFFVPKKMVVGTEYKGQGKKTKAYRDVYPKDFIKALRATIAKGNLLEADLDPGIGVWNYPIYRYEMNWERATETKVNLEVKIFFANDEVGIDDTFSKSSDRKDVKERAYTIELTVASNWNGKLESAKTAKWTGDSIDDHPDALILGLENEWRETILDYRGSDMEAEVNFELLKSHDDFESIVDSLLNIYYKR